jgi:hypothetical protein
LFNLSDDMSTFRARPVCELYNISKPTILQVRCRDPISILRNLCPWHSALFAVLVLFVCSYRTFLLVCMPSLWLYVVCGVFSPKSRQLFIQIPCLIFLVLFFAFRANEIDYLRLESSNSTAATIRFAICFPGGMFCLL